MFSWYLSLFQHSFNIALCRAVTGSWWLSLCRHLSTNKIMCCDRVDRSICYRQGFFPAHSNSLHEYKINLVIKQRMYIEVLPWCLEHIAVWIRYLFYSPCFLGQNGSILSHTAMHKAMSIYAGAFHLSWYSVSVIWKLLICCSATVMADVSLSQLLDRHSAATVPVVPDQWLVTAASCSAVREDYWSGLEWC